MKSPQFNFESLERPPASPEGAPATYGRPEAAGLVSSINKVKTGSITDLCFGVPLRDVPDSRWPGRTVPVVGFVSVRIRCPEGGSRRDVIDALRGALERAIFEGFDRA